MGKEMTYKILMVDDDPELLKLNRHFFEECGYETVCVETARLAMDIISTARFDCVILDIDLPDSDGFDVCTAIRATSSLPIVFLSAYSEEENRIRGLSIGGDDFVSKPYSLPELGLRVQLRIQAHRKELPDEILCFDDLMIDTGRRIVSYNGETGELSRIEFDILAFLARHPERVFSYEQLYDSVWREPLNLGRHAVQARIADLRQKLYAICPDKEYIRTIRHKGYQFVP